MNHDNILGCFCSGPAVYYNDDPKTKEIAEEKGKLFRSYIWGEKGISDVLKKLEYKKYGQDIRLILFQFYLNPLPFQLPHLKEIEGYRKKEKAIGVPIIITDENFFNKDEVSRFSFLKEVLLSK